ncbi:heparan sulfate 2-O-sulfotransferase 1-like isoform X2 [Oscarella lobularis]|uniref:heparan sulfate 2-O-sulfotransferase 1-like isoform X2 n=1 Tax=Oscarella lobularis TaxID=121494 RepID=UPI003313F452
MKSPFVLLLLALVALCLVELQIMNLQSAIVSLKRTESRSRSTSMSNFVNTKAMTTGSQATESLVMYNRVPKTGSTTFMGLVYSLCAKNEFNAIHLNTTKNSQVMSIADQYHFSHNITAWTEKLPGFYHGHVSYIDFPRFGVPQPIYLQIVRDPLERLVSYYYFLRYGDDFRPYLSRSKMGDKTTFDQCVKKKMSDCAPEKLWLQIPFFCGQEPACWQPGNKWALDKAKEHLVTQYLAVGLTDQIPEYLAVLEAVLPRFFKGASALYAKNLQKKGHLRKTVKKDPVTAETIETFKKNPIWEMENDFYLYAKSVFEDIKTRTIRRSKDSWVFVGKNYHFEKIKP